MNWSIKPEAARDVCTNTDTAAEGFETAVSAIVEAFEAVSAASGSETADAANQVSSDPFLIELSNLHGTVQHTTDTTRRVIEVYEQGDLEMAEDIQREMDTDA